jgi:hypothetical protein
MQAKLDRGEAAYRMRSVRLPVAIFAGVPLIAALAFLAPESALAACGAASPAGVHAATASSGVHATTSTPATAGGGGGVGTLGCANGASASALHGLPVAASGRVIETGAHASRATTHTARRTTNASAHLPAVRPAHHG